MTWPHPPARNTPEECAVVHTGGTRTARARCPCVQTPRHRATRRRPARVVLAVLKGATLGGLLTLAVAGGLGTAGSGQSPADRPDADPAQRVVARAVSDPRCSYGGFGQDAVPAS